MIMSELERAKLGMCTFVAIMFTTANLLHNTSWEYYILSLFVFPVITYLVVSALIKFVKK